MCAFIVLFFGLVAIVFKKIDFSDFLNQKKSRYKKTQPKKIEIQKNAAEKNRDTKKYSLTTRKKR